MDFNIKEKIEELVQKISGDKGLQEKFTKDPVSAVKSLLGGRGPAHGAAAAPDRRHQGQAEPG